MKINIEYLLTSHTFLLLKPVNILCSLIFIIIKYNKIIIFVIIIMKLNKYFYKFIVDIFIYFYRWFIIKKMINFKKIQIKKNIFKK